MFFFKKTEYEELMLPFELAQEDGDNEAGIISIRAYGDVFGEQKNCNACFCLSKAKMYDNGDYEQILSLLGNSEGKKVKVRFKMKKGKAKDFKIDVASLASAYGDERMNCLDLAGWGMFDR